MNTFFYRARVLLPLTNLILQGEDNTITTMHETQTMDGRTTGHKMDITYSVTICSSTVPDPTVPTCCSNQQRQHHRFSQRPYFTDHFTETITRVSLFFYCLTA
jgi:hypothetical protein